MGEPEYVYLAIDAEQAAGMQIRGEDGIRRLPRMVETGELLELPDGELVPVFDVSPGRPWALQWLVEEIVAIRNLIRERAGWRAWAWDLFGLFPPG